MGLTFVGFGVWLMSILGEWLRSLVVVEVFCYTVFMKEKDIFQLTNLYEVPKSLRFELKPTEETLRKLHNEEWYREPRNIFADGKAKMNGMVITPYHSRDILDEHFLQSAREKHV